MKYAAEILEELNICGGGKIEQSVRADAIAEIRACLAGKLYPAPRKYLRRTFANGGQHDRGSINSPGKTGLRFFQWKKYKK